MISRACHTTPFRRGLLALCAVVLLAAWGVGEVRAAPAAPRLSAADKKRARKLFFKGLAAFARQQYPDALALFLASWKIKKKSIVLYNIAMTHKALYQYRLAIDAFQRYIQRRGKKLNIWKKKQVLRTIALMTKRLGRLKLAVHPPEALVRVDGKVVGRAPLGKHVLVDPGRRSVEVSLRGYRTVRTELTVTRGQLVSLGIRLVAVVRQGRLIVTSRTPGARAAVGRRKSAALPLSLNLSVGLHRLRVSAPGYTAQEMTVTVRPGETTRHDVGLIPLGLRAPSKPVYKRWWLWTLVSVAVVAAGVSSGLLIWDRTRGGDNIDFSRQLR